MNEVSIIINGVRYDAVEFPYKSAPNKCESCDVFAKCFIQGNGNMRELCKLANYNVVFKFSYKLFEK